MTTSRTDFNETWLSEAPEGIPVADHYAPLVYNINDRIKHNASVMDLSNNYKKIVGGQVCYYWQEINNIIEIACELSIKPQALVVNSIGKRAGSASHATDLYTTILNDSKQAIKLMSDTRLTDNGLSVWKRLVNNGHNITVYDKSNPGQSMTLITNAQDLDRFVRHNDENYQNYQFVLSEASYLAEVRSFFNTRRLRELTGVGTED
jgi:hypothetical protein